MSLLRLCETVSGWRGLGTAHFLRSFPEEQHGDRLNASGEMIVYAWLCDWTLAGARARSCYQNVLDYVTLLDVRRTVRITTEPGS
jgi:hypothetical protein